MTETRAQAPAQAQPLRSPSREDAVPDRHQVADWTGLVDTISAAGAAAQVQTVAYETMASDLRRALADVETYKALIAQAQARAMTTTREIQAVAQARVEAIQAQAEARIEAIQAQADARVQSAEERAARADQRAEAVEEWLAQVDQASRALLPGTARATGRFGGSAAA